MGGGALIIRVSMRPRLPYLGNAKTMPRKGSAGRLRYFTNNGLMMAQIRGNSQKRNLTRMPIRSIFDAVERRHLSCKWAHMGSRTWEPELELTPINQRIWISATRNDALRPPRTRVARHNTRLFRMAQRPRRAACHMRRGYAIFPSR